MTGRGDGRAGRMDASPGRRVASRVAYPTRGVGFPASMGGASPVPVAAVLPC